MNDTILPKNKEEIPETIKDVTVERYTLLERFYHWIHVLIMLLFFFTGFELYSKTYVVGTEYFTQIFHFALGGIIVCWYLFFYLYFILPDSRYWMRNKDLGNLGTLYAWVSKFNKDCINFKRD